MKKFIFLFTGLIFLIVANSVAQVDYSFDKNETYKAVVKTKTTDKVGNGQEIGKMFKVNNSEAYNLLWSMSADSVKGGTSVVYFYFYGLMEPAGKKYPIDTIVWKQTSRDTVVLSKFEGTTKLLYPYLYGSIKGGASGDTARLGKQYLQIGY